MPDFKNRIFTAHFVIVFPRAIVNSVVLKFFENRMIWEARELPARTYGWVPFSTAHAGRKSLLLLLQRSSITS